MAGDILTTHTFDDSSFLAGLKRDEAAAMELHRQMKEMQRESVRSYSDALDRQHEAAIHQENRSQALFNNSRRMTFVDGNMRNSFGATILGRAQLEMQGWKAAGIEKQASFFENQWGRAIHKSQKLLFGFENVGMAAVIGVGTSVGIAAKAFGDFRERTSLANDALAATKNAADRLWMTIGQSAHIAASAWDSFIAKTIDGGTAFLKFGQRITLGTAAVTAMENQLAQDQQVRHQKAFDAMKAELDLEKETIAGYDQEAARIREQIRLEKELSEIKERLKQGVIEQGQADALKAEITANSEDRIKAVQEQRISAENAEFEKIASLARKAMEEEDQANRERMKANTERDLQQQLALEDLDIQRQARDLELEVMAAKQAEAKLNDPAARRALQEQNNRDIAIRRENIEYARELQAINRNDALSFQYKTMAAEDLNRQHQRALDLIKSEEAEKQKDRKRSSSVPVGFGVSSAAAATFGSSPVVTVQQEQVKQLKDIHEVLKRIANKAPTAMSAVYS